MPSDVTNNTTTSPVTSRTTVWHRLEVPMLVAVPIGLGLCAYYNVNQAALMTVAVAALAVLVFFVGWETDRPPLRQFMPTVVLGALAAVGRIAFSAFPDAKPVTAICIIAGALFGRRSGFMVGALAGLASNFFFGQGPWTPWQMYAWGLAGYIAGCIGENRFAAHPWLIPVWGAAAALLYGFILNSWFIIGYVHPITLPKALAAYGAAIALDGIHAVATVLFLGVLYLPWARKLTRIKEKFALG